jgi:diadenosine tetraphosphate (Ap4A) HIT family hydrolase
VKSLSVAAHSCPFCDPPEEQILFASEAAISIADAFPVSCGHTLVVPRKHVRTIYELRALEQQTLWTFGAEVRTYLVDKYNVEAFNIGLNDGVAAGQTVSHAHIHVIPRRPGDVHDPRGGIRWVVAEKALYWKK